MEKQCTKCKVVKSCIDFYKSDKNNDGLEFRCKSCNNKETKKWVNNNREQYKEYQRQYQKERKANDINFRLAINLRARLRKALLRQITSKNDTTEALLGISYSEFKEYIEYLMTPDMNWLNIQLDHVRPLSSFDLKDYEQLKEATHYTNIQPLLAKDNLSKGDRFHEHDIWPQSENLYNYETFKFYFQLLNE